MLNFDDAKEEHATLGHLEQVLVKVGLQDGGRELWDAITQTAFQPNTDLAAQVSLWTPIDAIALVRAKSAIAAGFALACMGELLLERVVAKQGIPTNDPQAAMELARAGWAKFEERRTIAETLKGGLGCTLDASWEHARDVQAVNDQNQIDEIKRIGEIAGRMYTVLAEIGPKTEIDGVGEVRNVQSGGDLERLVPDELAKITDEGDMGELAMLDLLEDKSLEYEQKKIVPGARGPLVILRDESGSMDNETTGDSRNAWASAAALALARTAHDGGRVASVVHFGTAVAVTDLFPGDSKALLDMARHFLNGGTAIGLALEVGIKQVEKLAAKGHHGADLVLVTDGEDYDVQRINAALDKADALNIDLYTVLVECDIGESHPLVARAKKVVRVGDPNNTQIIASLRDATLNMGAQQGAPAPGAPGASNTGGTGGFVN